MKAHLHSESSSLLHLTDAHKNQPISAKQTQPLLFLLIGLAVCVTSSLLFSVKENIKLSLMHFYHTQSKQQSS